MILRVSEKFDSAHQLNDYVGKCARLHGHTWKIEVYIKVDKLQPNGISIDFSDVKAFLREYLPDHRHLNEFLDMRHPTAENLVMYFYNDIKNQFPGLMKVVLWETENNAVEFTGI